MKKLIIAAFVLLCASCGQSLEERMNQKFSAMGEMAELGTVEYTITKIIKADDNAFYTVGDRKILFSCQSTMKAGISLADFKKENVKVNEAEKSVEIVLPKAKVLALNMPAEKITLEKIVTICFVKERKPFWTMLQTWASWRMPRRMQDYSSNRCLSK